MSVISLLASTLGRRDEAPNQQLAENIVKSGDGAAIAELVSLLNDKNKDIQNDCIKVLYEIGAQKPALISGYEADFIELLKSRNNRMQWGAMTALGTIALENPDSIFEKLPVIIDAANQGSVIATDNLMVILIKLASIPKYAENAFSLLNEQLKHCPTNQLPMYAENVLPIINATNKAAFIATLTARLPEIEKESKRNRVEKVIKKVLK